MCGIVGIVKGNELVNRQNFFSMVNTLRSRGPDGRGAIFVDGGRVALGHTRLSIIDLSDAGRQPMCNEDGTVWITFNGEIYNYKYLRTELERRGHGFKSRSDTETIIHAYEEWGVECVRRFRGIFAFGVYDSRKRQLFIGRDHVGVKPLYYYDGPDKFIFASQPKTILRAEGFFKGVDPEAFSLYLAYGNVPADRSIYKGIKKLLPGHCLVLRDDRIDETAYWSLRYEPSITVPDEAKRALASKLRECVAVQSVSDVPIGALLSGGVDSTILTSIMTSNGQTGIDTFTIGFEETESDERKYASFVADAYRTTHHQEMLTYEAALSMLPKIIEACDEPFHLNGLFPMYALSQLARKTNRKVVMGGDGGDELFAGYSWYERFNNYMAIATPRTKKWRDKMCSRMFNKPDQFDPVSEFFKFNGSMSKDQQYVFAGPALNSALESVDLMWPLRKHWKPELPPVLAAQFLDFNCFLVDHCLYKVDRASMACGVEVRVPFLDPELVSMAFTIAHNITFSRDERKAILKEALADCFPPGMDLQRKKGFSSPMHDWLNRGLGTAGLRLLCDGSLCSRGLVNAQILTDTYAHVSPQVQLLLVSAELWSRRWLESDNESGVKFSALATAAGAKTPI